MTVNTRYNDSICSLRHGAIKMKLLLWKSSMSKIIIKVLFYAFPQWPGMNVQICPLGVGLVDADLLKKETGSILL